VNKKYNISKTEPGSWNALKQLASDIDNHSWLQYGHYNKWTDWQWCCHKKMLQLKKWHCTENVGKLHKKKYGIVF